MDNSAYGGIAYESAKHQVKFYAEQPSLMQEHLLAMNCRDCEDFLQLGIDCFKWLSRAEECLRQEVYKGKRKNDGELSEALDHLYSQWQIPVRWAEKWVESQRASGYEPDNLNEFHSVCDQVQTVVDERQWSNIAAQSRLDHNENW